MTMRAAWFALLAAFALLFVAAPAGRTADMPFQRMVLAAGCYVIEPHAFTDVSAFCLDQELPAPGHGVVLASAPDALGDTFLTIDHKKVGLDSALDQHLIRLEGLGGQNYFHVRIRNMGAARIEICINAPTVVMGNSGYPTADLTKIYGEIIRVLPHASDAEHSRAKDSDNEELEATLALQKKLWEVTEKARLDEEERLDERTPGETGPADRPALTLPKNCAGTPGSTLVCTEK
jgi:hypothetical protein